MIQRREDFRFPPEPHETLGIERERIRENLDGNGAFQVRVRRAIHLAHAARANRRLDFVRTKSSAER
jgi:hypothetical protein